jgi:thiamine pyrophosphate-dependent acetolactate synthase large subunit-like protein
VARALKAEGVEAIFTLCGGHIIDMYDGCLDARERTLGWAVPMEKNATYLDEGQLTSALG